MIKWQPFVFDNQCYDLSHLHPFRMEHRQAADGKGNSKGVTSLKSDLASIASLKPIWAAKMPICFMGTTAKCGNFVLNVMRYQKTCPKSSRTFLIRTATTLDTATIFLSSLSTDREQKQITKCILAFPDTKKAC